MNVFGLSRKLQDYDGNAEVYVSIRDPESFSYLDYGITGIDVTEDGKFLFIKINDNNE